MQIVFLAVDFNVWRLPIDIIIIIVIIIICKCVFICSNLGVSKVNGVIRLLRHIDRSTQRTFMAWVLYAGDLELGSLQWEV